MDSFISTPDFMLGASEERIPRVHLRFLSASCIACWAAALAARGALTDAARSRRGCRTSPAAAAADVARYADA